MRALTPNAQYNVAAPMSLPTRIAAHTRRQMFARFLRSTAIRSTDTLLDVGVTSDQTYEASNYVEAWYPHKDRITAAGVDDASFLEQRYPGVKFVEANGLALPFESESFDIVHSSAVLEHVGNATNQRKFLSELERVARHAVFVTTPNRWFPVEFHTVLPLVHWLPKATFRRLLKDGKYDFFSKEENLNLLSRRELLALSRDLPGGWPARVESQRLGGLTSNLLLTLRKPAN